MTDLVETLKSLYLKAYRGDEADRVSMMDLLSVAIHYATTGHRDLAWEIAATFGVKP